MNWQKLNNVNLPPRQIVMVWVPELGGTCVKFAERYTNKDGMDCIRYSSEYYISKYRTEHCQKTSYSEFKAKNSETQWCIFHEP